MMLRIRGRANSINVQKVLWCCHEIGLEYARIDAGLQFGVNDTPEYAAMNPTGLVPTIEDGDVRLWESNVIVRYLSHKHSIGGLFPADVATRFDAERWMDWQTSQFWAALCPLYIALMRTPVAQRDAAAMARAHRLSEASVRVLEGRLADRPFLSGETLTMGDIPAAVTVHRWYGLDIERPQMPNVMRWYDRMRQRPPFRRIVMTPLS
jgi:glutathione S-transferase